MNTSASPTDRWRKLASTRQWIIDRQSARIQHLERELAEARSLLGDDKAS